MMPNTQLTSWLRVFSSEVRRAVRRGATPDTPIGRALLSWSTIYRAFARERFDAYSRGGGNWPPLADSTIRSRLYRKHRAADKRRREKQLAAHYEREHKFKQRTANAQGSKAGREWSRKEAQKFNEHEKSAKRRNRLRQGARRSKRFVNAIQPGRFSILRDTGRLFNALNASATAADGAITVGIPGGVRVGIGGPARHGQDNATIGEIAHYHQRGGVNLPARPIIVPPPQSVRREMSNALRKGISRAMQESRRRWRSGRWS